MSGSYRKPRILPLVWLAITLAAQFALDRWLPLHDWIHYPYILFGLLPLLLGLGGMGWAAGALNKLETGIMPFSKSTALVTSGLYRYTRNPMYLGMVLMLTGIALLLGAISALFPVIAFAWIIDRSYVRNEEIFLRELHGETFDRYVNQVRRWI